MANNFRILLGWISARLNEQEVRNLVSMCDVPEGQRAEMKDGLCLFECLIKRDFINEKKLDRLKTMLKNLNPKRRDLIKEIQNFENGTLTCDDASSTLGSVRSIPSTICHAGRSDVKKTCCKVECPCMMMTCYKYNGKVAWSYVGYFAFFLTCFITVVLLWYANVPKASEAIASDEHVKKAAPFILIAIVILFLACLFPLYYVRKRRDRARTAGEENGMQEVHTRHLVRRTGTSKTEKNRASTANFGFIDDDLIADSATEDLEEQDAILRSSN